MLLWGRLWSTLAPVKLRRWKGSLASQHAKMQRLINNRQYVARYYQSLSRQDSEHSCCAVLQHTCSSSSRRRKRWKTRAIKSWRPTPPQLAERRAGGARARARARTTAERTATAESRGWCRRGAGDACIRARMCLDPKSLDRCTGEAT
jgi:hypothetical protein